jgi:hypothetical protein
VNLPAPREGPVNFKDTQTPVIKADTVEQIQLKAE